MCHSTFHLHLLPSPPTAITHLREMTLVSSAHYSCCLWVSSTGCWIFTIQHTRPWETSHPLINSPSVCVFVSFFYPSLTCYLRRYLSLSHPHSAKTNKVLTRGGNWAEMNRSPALDAYFPTERLNDHIMVCWLFELFISNKTFEGNTSNFSRMDLMRCGLRKPHQLMWAQSNHW